jgi:hypothetical protein
MRPAIIYPLIWWFDLILFDITGDHWLGRRRIAVGVSQHSAAMYSELSSSHHKHRITVRDRGRDRDRGWQQVPEHAATGRYYGQLTRHLLDMSSYLFIQLQYQEFPRVPL